MAGGAAKKSAKAKQKASSRYFPLLVASTCFFVVVRLVLRRSTATKWHYFALFAASTIYALTYGPIVEAAGGPSGIAEYLYDIMVLTLFAQTLGAVTDYAWLVGLLVPVFCLFKLAELYFKRRPAANSDAAGQGPSPDGGAKKKPVTSTNKRRR